MLELLAKHSKTIRQMMRFCLVGLANTVVDFTIYLSITRTWAWWLEHYLVANIIAFVIANTFSFIINKSWTFNNKEYSTYHHQYLKFLVVSAGALAIVELSLFMFVSIFDMYDLVGKAAGIAVSIAWSFSIHRYWTFRSSS